MQAERTDMNTIDKFNSHIMGSYGRLNVVLDKGEDDKAVDENGKTYIDFGSGIGTNSLGYCNKEWADAVCVNRYAVYSIPQIIITQRYRLSLPRDYRKRQE